MRIGFCTSMPSSWPARMASIRLWLGSKPTNRSVPVSDYVTEYVVKLVRATRPKDPTAPDFVKRMVDYGAGVRAGQYLVRAGQYEAIYDDTPVAGLAAAGRAVPVDEHSRARSRLGAAVP